jgi:hypothetical protein
VAILSPKNVRFELRDPNFVMKRIFVTFRNNLNECWDFYMVPTWVLVDSPKANNTNNQKIGPHKIK